MVLGPEHLQPLYDSFRRWGQMLRLYARRGEHRFKPTVEVCRGVVRCRMPGFDTDCLAYGYTFAEMNLRNLLAKTSFKVPVSDLVSSLKKHVSDAEETEISILANMLKLTNSKRVDKIARLRLHADPPSYISFDEMNQLVGIDAGDQLTSTTLCREDYLDFRHLAASATEPKPYPRMFFFMDEGEVSVGYIKSSDQSYMDFIAITRLPSTRELGLLPLERIPLRVFRPPVTITVYGCTKPQREAVIQIRGYADKGRHVPIRALTALTSNDTANRLARERAEELRRSLWSRRPVQPTQRNKQ